MKTPTFNSFGNALLINQSSFKAGGKFTDANHIFNMFGEAPFTTHLGLLTAFNQMKLVATPLLNQTELRKNVILVNGAQGRFTFSMPFELEGVRVIEDPNDTTIGRLGIDNQPFRVIFSEDIFSPNDIVTYDDRDGKQLFIRQYIGSVGEGHEYEVTLITQNPKQDYVTRDVLQPGIQYWKIGNILNEFDQEGSAANSQTGEMLFENRMSAHRMVEAKITRYADDLQIPEIKSNSPQAQLGNQFLNYLKPTNQNYLAIFGAYKDGKPVKGSGSYATMLEMLLMAELRKMEEHQLMWGKPGIATGSRNQSKIVKAGLYEQLRLGNRYLVPRISRNVLENAFFSLFANRPDIKIEERYIKVQAGAGAYYEILRIFADEMKNLPFVNLGADLNVIRKASFVNNSVQNLTGGYQFIKVFLPGVGTVEVEHNPAFDVNTSRKADEPKIGNFHRWQYTCAILDVTDSNATNAAARTPGVEFMEGANQNANIFLVKPKQHVGDIITVVPGRGMSGTGLFGSTSGGSGRILAATKEPATTITIENHSEIWIKDPTRTILIELDKDQPLYR